MSVSSVPKYNIGDAVINNSGSWASIVSHHNYMYHDIGWYGIVVERKLETEGNGCCGEWGYKIEVECNKYCCKAEKQLLKAVMIPKEESLRLNLLSYNVILRDSKIKQLLDV
jgi:hypothetical protein